MDTHGASLLGNTSDGQFYLLACRHDEVAVLVDNNNDVRHELMTLLRIELAGNELRVVFLDVAHVGILQQLITRIHLDTERLQGADDLRGIGDDGILELLGQGGKEVAVDSAIDAELHHLRVDEHNLQLGRMLLI